MYTREVVCLFEMRNRLEINNALLVIKEVTTDNVIDARSFQSKRQLTMFYKFLKKGDKGYFAYLDGTCAHRSWVVQFPGKVSIHPLYQEPLQPNEIFIHFCETAPWARGKNIFTSVLSNIGQQFKNERVLIAVDKENLNSIKSITKSGFTEINRFRIISFLGIKTIKNKLIA